MIGAKSFDISSVDFIKGMTSSPYLTDGGFTNESYGMNVNNTPGLMYTQGAITDKSTNLASGKSLIASSEDPRSSSQFARLMVDNAGNYYTWNATTLTNVHTDGTNPGKYTSGITDMIAFGGVDIYTTNEVAISRWIVSSATFTDSFQAFDNTNCPHPALVFEGNAFYGDGQFLWRQTTAGTPPTKILTLNNPGQIIVALGIDPGSGRMLISIVDGTNASDTLNKTTRIGYYDGFSNKLLKEVITDDLVTAFHPVGGILYITYGQNLGSWTGAGIQFLRALAIQLVSTNLAYKQHVSHIETTLYVIEGAKILAYGNIIKGQSPVFYYPIIPGNVSSLSTVASIMNLGSGLLGYAGVTGSTTAKFFTADMVGVGSVTQVLNLYSLRYTFPRPVEVDQVIVEFGAPFAGGTFSGTVAIIDDKQVSNSLTLTGVAADYQIQSNNPSISTRSIQVNYSISVNVLPLRRITVFYSDTDGHI